MTSRISMLSSPLVIIREARIQAPIALGELQQNASIRPGPDI